MKRFEDVKEKIANWNGMNISYLKEIKSLVTDMEGPKRFQIISYFTYSLNIFHEQGRENFCLGSYHIQNVGDKPLTNPYICIKVSPESPFEFSGKYVYKNSRQKMGMANAWERINEATDKHEFWLKPANNYTLESFETLSFENFQVKWLPNTSYAGSIMGFTYGEEISDGMNALNQINIGGVAVKGDENE